MSAVGAQGHWARLAYACVTQLNVVLCVGCDLFSVLLVLALLARSTCADLLLWQLGWVVGKL